MNFLAVLRTASELSDRAISATRRFTETGCDFWVASDSTARMRTVSSVS
jgi:hypothetical protein